MSKNNLARNIVFLIRLLVGLFYSLLVGMGLVLLITFFDSTLTLKSLIKNWSNFIINGKVIFDSLLSVLILYLSTIVTQISLLVLTTYHIRRINDFFKFLLLMPFSIGVLAPSFAFLILFEPTLGPFDFEILSSSVGGTFAIVIIDTWQWLGVLLTITYIKMDGIPPSYYEKAKLEDLTKLESWKFIVWPKIRGIVAIYMLFRLIDWIRKEDIIQALFGKGGPGHFAETYGMYVKELYYLNELYGLSAFLSLAQLIVLTALIIFLTRITKINKKLEF